MPLSQCESSCKTLHMKMSLICMKMNLYVKHIFALRVVLTQRQTRTRKWAIHTEMRPETKENICHSVHLLWKLLLFSHALVLAHKKRAIALSKNFFSKESSSFEQIKDLKENAILM